MKYTEEVEKKIKLLVETFDELSKNPLYTKVGRTAYASSKIEVLQVFYGGDHEEETN